MEELESGGHAPTDDTSTGPGTKSTDPIGPATSNGADARHPFLPASWQEITPGSTRASDQPGGNGKDRTPSPTSGVPVWRPVVASSEPSEPAPATGTATASRSPGWPWVAVATVAALIGAVVGGTIVAAVNHSAAGTAEVKEISAGPALLNGTTNIQSVIAKVLPAVVSIDAKSNVASTATAFGGAPAGATEDQGTGMIITSDGEVVTNNHVISGATTITVTLFGKTQSMPATLIDTDPTSDIALLQISGVSNLPTVAFGDSDDVQVGDAVVAIGNALGLSAGSPTVTQGIISATGRTVAAGDASGAASETLTNMFQTDAAINQGNSGGPLVDSSGKVIGMNTAVASNADGTSAAEDIGFAIPSNRIEQRLPALRSRSVGDAFLGVSLETLTPQLRSQYNFVPSEGAVVLQVESGSPADAAGLESGDVITSFDGKPVTSADQLAAAVQNDKPGTRATIGIVRGQAEKTLTATLGSSGQVSSPAGS
jgi:S1-C subfamily serine protease